MGEACGCARGAAACGLSRLGVHCAEDRHVVRRPPEAHARAAELGIRPRLDRALSHDGRLLLARLKERRQEQGGKEEGRRRLFHTNGPQCALVHRLLRGAIATSGARRHRGIVGNDIHLHFPLCAYRAPRGVASCALHSLGFIRKLPQFPDLEAQLNPGARDGEPSLYLMLFS